MLITTVIINLCINQTYYFTLESLIGYKDRYIFNDAATNLQHKNTKMK